MCGKRIFCFLERIVDLPKCRSDLLGTSTTKRVQYIHYTDHIKKGLKIPNLPKYLQGSHFIYATIPELGTRQHCRDNAAMFSGYCIFLYSLCMPTPFRHRDLNNFCNFLLPLQLYYMYIVALSLPRN